MQQPPPSPEALRARIAEVMLRDERRLARRLEGRSGADAGLLAAIAAAEARVARRRAAVPAITVPDELPISARRVELVETIREHQVVIVAGETGSGKSTQLPKLCIEAGRGVRGMIGHTQPRRIAARTVSERIAFELGSDVGGAVGYAVRFTDRVGDNTLVKVMTDGILLAETQRDRELLAYDTIIVDEAHERSLNIDFLLGYLAQLLPGRPDLKLIITSATIDTERFSAHFGHAPVIEVSGRGYPVEVRYRPYGVDEDDDRDQAQAICEALSELADEAPGDVLVFLSGEREINDTAEAVRRLNLPDTEILPLYARLSAAEQHRIFSPHRGRRVVLATNVAETSITVPGIRYVVDAGTARISRYSRRLKVQRLPIEAISQASANQRSGRCGRVAPGIAIRLYAEDDFESRPPFTEPEILRTNLASVILQMAALRLGDVASFPFVDPPDSRAINDGVALLEELGAFDPDEPDHDKRLTPLGRRLAQLPVDPRFARMVLEADRHGCAREVIVIAAALSIQDPRERPSNAPQAADEAHARFRGDGSDFLAFVRLWDYVRERRTALNTSQFRKLCRAEFLNYLRIREWQDITSQLRQVAATLGIKSDPSADARQPSTEATDGGVPPSSTSPMAHADQIHRSLLVGLLSHIGMRDGESREYRGARNARFVIANGSALAKAPPRWVMAAELVETNRLWARVAARIQPEWAERAADHLCKRTYSEPRWQGERGSAVITERVSLYGLPIVTGRTIDLARVDQVKARELFIWHALVEGDWKTRHSFVAANLETIARVRALEDRVRRRDLLAGDESIFSQYDTRIPVTVTSARHFDRWWKDEHKTRPDLLTFSVDALVNPEAGRVDAAAYPDEWIDGDRRYPLTYVYDVTSPDDGVTVHLPLVALDTVRDEGFDWLVAGHRRELVSALMRTLPKSTRRQLVPVTDHVDGFLEKIHASRPDERSVRRLVELLARHLTDTTTATVASDDFDTARLAPHLRITFSVEDADGRPVAQAKDLSALKAMLGVKVRDAIADATPTVERRGLTDWTIGVLPRELSVRQNGFVITSYPALVDEGSDNNTVGVRVFTSREEQLRSMRAGTRRLLSLTVPYPRKSIERQWGNDVRLAIAQSAARHLSMAALLDDCFGAALNQLITRHGGPAWDEEAFAALRSFVREEVSDTLSAIVTVVGRVALTTAAIDRRLDGVRAAALVPAVDDIRAQLAWLVHPGFVTTTPRARLDELVRYLGAIERRLDKLPDDAARDRQKMQTVQVLDREIEAALMNAPREQWASIGKVRWMLEELRVSLYAQALGTAHPVSEQRIRRELAAATGSLVPSAR